MVGSFCLAADRSQSGGEKSSEKWCESIASMKIKGSTNWLSLSNIFVLVEREIRLQRPQFPISRAKADVRLFPGATNRFMTIYYGVDHNWKPLAADIGSDFSIRIRDVKLENDIFVAP